ncbi:MAG: alpha/beta fold hydrolase [Anaerolineaceae bacterium]
MAVHSCFQPDVFGLRGVISYYRKRESNHNPTTVVRERYYLDITYGRDAAQKMDIYYPTNQSAAMPAVVYVHGGGWVEGDKSSLEAKSYIEELLNRGYVVFSLNYRLAPEHPFPAQIQDVKSALRAIRAGSNEFRIDPERTGIFGSSAGGHLASLAGVTSPTDGFEQGENLDQSSQVQAVVDLFGPTDINLITLPEIDNVICQTFGNHATPSEEYRLASPTAHTTADDPPFLIIHGDMDRVVPLDQSQLLYETLRKAGVSAELLVVKNGGHGFFPQDEAIKPSNDEISIKIADFFDRYLK